MRYVAFLRAINVGGHIVRMDVLRKSFVRLGFQDVETFIASGNVLFTSPSRDTARLERQIEGRLEQDLGYEVSTFVRTSDDVISIAAYQPFPEGSTNGAMLYVGFLADSLPALRRKTLEGLCTPIDTLHVNKREWYWLCQKKQSESRISNATIEKTLSQRSTLRGMNTLVRLAKRLQSEQ